MVRCIHKVRWGLIHMVRCIHMVHWGCIHMVLCIHMEHWRCIHLVRCIHDGQPLCVWNLQHPTCSAGHAPYEYDSHHYACSTAGASFEFVARPTITYSIMVPTSHFPGPIVGMPLAMVDQLH